MKNIQKRLFWALPFLIVMYVGVKVSFGQPASLPKSLLMELLDAPTTNVDSVKKILGDQLSNKWILYVNYSGPGAREVAVKFLVHGALAPAIQKIRSLPFLDIFETVPVNQDIEFEVRLSGGTKINYPIYTPKCGSANGCLTLVRLGTGPAGFSEQTIQFPPPKQPNWLVRPSIPLFIAKRKASVLTAFFAASTIATYKWYHEEDSAVNDHNKNYQAAFLPEKAEEYRIKTEKAITRRETAQRLSIVSGIIFGILLMHDFVSSKPIDDGASIEEETGRRFASHFQLKLGPVFSDESFSLGVSMRF